MLNYTTMTYLTNGCSVSLQSQKTRTYLALDTKNYKFNLKGFHPFLENKDVKTNLSNQSKFYLFNYNDPKSKDVLLYGNSICLMTQEEFFLCGANNGDLVLERLKGNGMLISSNLPINSKFTILDGFNIDNTGKAVCFDDDIVLRSNFGYYMVIDNMDIELYQNFSAVSCSATMVLDESLFKFVNSEVPFIPDWAIKRKHINYNHSSYLFEELNSREKAKKAASKKKNLNKKYEELHTSVDEPIISDEKIPLMSRNKEAQEKALLEDLLLNLLGFEGNYIKRNTTNKDEVDRKENEMIVTNLLFSNSTSNAVNSKLSLLKDPIKLEEEIKRYVNKFEIEPYLDNPTCGKYSFILIF